MNCGIQSLDWDGQNEHKRTALLVESEQSKYNHKRALDGDHEDEC